MEDLIKFSYAHSSFKGKQSFQEESNSYTANRQKKRFPATYSNKTNSRTAEIRSTSPQVITAFFPSGQRVRIFFQTTST